MSAVSFREFTVRACAEGGWEVVQDGKTTGQLCMGEMLEQVVKLAVPGTSGKPYPMKTPEEWDDYARRRQERIAQAVLSQSDEERYVEGLQR